LSTCLGDGKGIQAEKKSAGPVIPKLFRNLVIALLWSFSYT